MHDRSRAPALAPTNALVFGLQVVSIVVLARDTLFQGDLRGSRTCGATASVQDRRSETEGHDLSCRPHAWCCEPVNRLQACCSRGISTPHPLRTGAATLRV